MRRRCLALECTGLSFSGSALAIDRGCPGCPLGIGFLYYRPTLLALVSRAAPVGVKATMMGAVFLSLFLANTMVGYLGGLYERMTPATFWAMHAGIATVGGVVAFGSRQPLMY